MRFYSSPLPLAVLSYLPSTPANAAKAGKCVSDTDVSLQWHAPAQSEINNLTTAINGTGIYNFIFNSSQSPPDVYNWCNMPHINPSTYSRPSSSYKLEYVEIIHRHHKRTPYADNTFPYETYAWDCSDEGLFYGGEPLNPAGNESANTYWSVYTSPSNPLRPAGFNGTCQFPQITRGGLDDSHQHGADLFAVYSTLLAFLPSTYDPASTTFRVTNNVITSQVASMLIPGMYPALTSTDIPLLIQPASIDSLEPAYTCSQADALSSRYGAGSSSPAWTAHLTASSNLKKQLDAISGVNPNATDWSQSWDHYFDNLSARLCHSKPLPCSANDPTQCVTDAMANEVFRLGEYEYSYLYRDAQQSLAFSKSSFGIWIAELASNLRDAMSPSTSVSDEARPKYRHNVAHDGSVSRLLSILQLDRMVWPGMGAEVAFELYSKDSCYFVRVLWGGQVLESSHPAFGKMELLPVDTLLAYFDGLVGRGARKVPGLCATPLCEVDGEGCADD
ncbi:hypothetical protein LTR09_010366 [Extremus antarcticus]|uniref:Acid phosphatase n=1 Tax=Extremus antarcticus TaxID=702011 RepID=A0AAJ0G8M3_9PEZI|nr:hypothetical protein LTR09_010366 [Extremus antarcticus]